MAADLFISYAWTSDQHRLWAHLLAAQLKALGYDVLIDADVVYGDSLTGFMRRVVDADHVLMITDDNYVERADNCPESGVGIENRWLREAHPERPMTWLSVLFKDNLDHTTPSWLAEHKPKGFSFNHILRSRTTSPDRSRWTSSGAGSRDCPRTRTRLRPSPSCASGPPGSSATS